MTEIWASGETIVLEGRVSMDLLAKSTSTAMFILPLMFADFMDCCSAILFMKPKEPELMVKSDC